MRLKYILATIIITLLAPLSGILAATPQDKETDSSATVLLFNAMKEYNNGNYSQANVMFQQLAAIKPDNDAAYYYLANIAIKTDDAPSGELYLKKGIELDSTNFWYREMLGQLYIQNKKVEQAVKVYEELLEMYPKKSAIYYSLVNLYLSTQQTTQAKEMLAKIEGIQGKSEAVAMTYYNIYRMEQNWEKALNYLVEFDKEIQSPRIQCVIGDTYANRYKDSLAMHYYNKALQLDKECAPAMYGKAEIHRSNGNFAEFFADITPFFAAPSIDTQMKIEYMKQLFQIPNFIKRFRYQLDSALAGMEIAHPADTTSNMFLASYYGEVGNTKKCKQLLWKNHELHPQKYSMHIPYIFALYELEEWENLENASTDALVAYPADKDLILLRGIARYRQDKAEKAIESYKELEAVALKGKDTNSLITAYSMLSELYHNKKDNATTYAYMKKVLKLRPDDLGTLNNYAYYLALEGKNLKKAYQMSKKTVEADPDNITYLDTFGWILFLMDKPIEAKAQFKHAMLYGATSEAVILDHYADVLFKLGEHDLAFIYWNQAKNLNNSLGIEEKIKEKKALLKK